jgi:two-component system sensor histidine kinase CpxA
MKLPLPLSLKISLWLLLNMLLLVVAGVAFLVSQFGFGWESLVSRQAMNRLYEVARFIQEERQRDVPVDFNKLLNRYGTAYGAELLLYSEDGQQLGGNQQALPVELVSQVAMTRRPGGDQGRFFGMPPGFPDNRIQAPRPSVMPAQGANPGGPDLGAMPPPPPAMPEPRGEFGDFGRKHHLVFFRGGSPVRYWVGTRIFYFDTKAGTPRGAVLFAVTHNMVGAGLLYDLRPWVLGGCIMFIVSVLFWMPFVGSMTRAIREMTRVTERLALGQFETKVRSDRADELGRLGEAINTLSARLNGYVHGQKRFLADVAHELGSPLGRLQMGIGILEERADPALRERVADVCEEIQQMSELVAELLAFTKAGLDSKEIVLNAVPLAPLVSRVVAREGAGAMVEVVVDEEFAVQASSDLLSRALGNLVRNAVRYAGSQGPIRVSARREGAELVLSVEDQGPGVPAEALPFLGEPFYRPATAREREAGGTGLGLSIVRTAVVACRGSVSFANRSPRGFRAEIRLQGTSVV